MTAEEFAEILAGAIEGWYTQDGVGLNTMVRRLGFRSRHIEVDVWTQDQQDARFELGAPPDRDKFLISIEKLPWPE